jgi:hypothetical protein
LEKNLKITDKKVTFLPGVETPVDHSDVAISQQRIVGRHTTGKRAEDGRIAFNFVPEAKILEISKSKICNRLVTIRHRFIATNQSRGGQNGPTESVGSDLNVRAVPCGGRNRERRRALDTVGQTSLEIGHGATRAAPPLRRRPTTYGSAFLNPANLTGMPIENS